jgi:hypothetical protein
MAGSFPVLKAGNTVFYPLVQTYSFGTEVKRFIDDSEQRHRNRLLLRRFALTCNDIHAYDVSLLRTFFRTQSGKFDSGWDLTFGGVTYSNLAFDQDNFPTVESKNNRMSITFQVIQVKSSNPVIPAAQLYFPQMLGGGVTTSLPYASDLAYRTVSEDMENGKRYAYKFRTNPLGRFSVNLPLMRAAEVATLETFIVACEGRLREFTFLDPGGNLVAYSDDFSHASWTSSSVTIGGAVTDPKGGSLARSCSSGGSNGFLHTSVLPAGNGSGIVLCASVWARATSSSQTLSIGFLDSGLSALENSTWALPQNIWTRIHHTITLATSSPIRIVIGGNSTWNGSTIQLFSGQCVAMPGPGPRLLTPGAEGLRAKCRLGQDDISIRSTGVNQHAATILIEEYP